MMPSGEMCMSSCPFDLVAMSESEDSYLWNKRKRRAAARGSERCLRRILFLDWCDQSRSQTVVFVATRLHVEQPSKRPFRGKPVQRFVSRLDETCEDLADG